MRRSRTINPSHFFSGTPGTGLGGIINFEPSKIQGPRDIIKCEPSKIQDLTNQIEPLEPKVSIQDVIEGIEGIQDFLSKPRLSYNLTTETLMTYKLMNVIEKISAVYFNFNYIKPESDLFHHGCRIPNQDATHSLKDLDDQIKKAIPNFRGIQHLIDLAATREVMTLYRLGGPRKIGAPIP